MKYLIVDPQEIEVLNRFSTKRITPVKIKSDNWVVRAELLNDKDTWGFAHEYLLACIEVELRFDDFVTDNLLN